MGETMTTSRSQERRVAVQREADPIARLRAMLDAATPGEWRMLTNAPADPYGYVEIGTDAPCMRVLDGYDDERDRRDAWLVCALRTLAPELLAVAEAAEHEPRTNADGETTTLALAVDALRARAAEVTR